MNTKSQQTETDCQYNWGEVFAPNTVRTHSDFLKEMEQRWIPGPSTVETVFQLLTSNPACVRTAVCAATYRAVRPKTPTVKVEAMVEVADKYGSNLDENTVRRVAHKLDSTPNLETPLEYLEKIEGRFNEEEFEKVRCELANVPSHLYANRKNSAIVGAAIYRALDITQSETCEEYLNGNLTEVTLRKTRDGIEEHDPEAERRKRLISLEQEHNLFLRNELDALDVESIELAVEIEETIGVDEEFTEEDVDAGSLPYTFSIHMEGLENVGLVEADDGSYRLTDSCFTTQL